MNKRSVLILLTIFSIAMATGISWGKLNMWEKVSSTFFKDDKPYGTGDFRIRDNQIISFKLSEAETTFQPDSTEYTEAWMNNVYELANRDSVRVLTGTVNGTLRRVFEKPGQQGAWWLSPDWNVLYVSTGWMDYREQPAPGERYTPQLTKLFKSTDQGQSWQQLEWPQDANIGHLMFLDKQRGYAVGWGPHIWRTADGGENWKEIAVPPLAKDPSDSRKRFNMVALGKDGVLRFSFIAENPQQKITASQIYALSWDDTVPALVATLPGQTLADITDHRGDIYILAWRGTSFDEREKSPPKTTVYHLTKQGIEPLHEFADGFKGYALYITPGGGLLTGGQNKQDFFPTGMIAVSYDQGRSWKTENQGGTSYDAETGTLWKVEAYSLYKQQIP